jgi:hypothetical protein
MATSEANRAVHRLVDMVVEEVSLVDRAANQHRFLIVKRSEPMDQNTAPAQAATDSQAGDETAPPAAEEMPTDLNEEPDADSGETLDADSPEVLGSDAGTEQPSAFALATQALQSLTAAVQMLASVPKDEAQEQIAELARQLGAIEPAGSAESSDDSPIPPPENEGDTAKKAPLPAPRNAQGQPDAVNTKLDSIAAGLRPLAFDVCTEADAKSLAAAEQESAVTRKTASEATKVSLPDDEAPAGAGGERASRKSKKA